MADQEAAPATNQRFYKLSDFWSASPAAWFGVVDAQFLLHGTEAQRDRLALVTAVLPVSSARRVAHILAAPGDTCYTDLKAALLAAYQLTSFQKAEPAPAVRHQLTEDDQEDMRALAEKAVNCAASIHRQHASAPIFSATVDDSPDAEDQEEIAVAAVGSSRSGRGGQHGRGGQSHPCNNCNGQRPQQQQQHNTAQPPADTPLWVACQASRLCKSHFRYGDKAYNCGGNCAWQGN